MKKLYLIFFGLFSLLSCNDRSPKGKYYEKIIIVKRYQNSFSENLPKGICNFYLNNEYYFQDSCKFYMMGDTIGITKIRK